MQHSAADQYTVRRPKPLWDVSPEIHLLLDCHVGLTFEFEGHGLDVVQIFVRIAHHLIIPQLCLFQLIDGRGQFPLPKIHGKEVVSQFQFRQLVGQGSLPGRLRGGVRELFFQAGAGCAGHPATRP